MKSLSISDRKKLSSLYERYGCDDILKFNNVLNESFDSNILRVLDYLNSKDHVGINGLPEKALSPIGAAFMKAFPIPWENISDNMIKIEYDKRMYPVLPKDDAEHTERLMRDDRNGYYSTKGVMNNIKKPKLISYVSSNDDLRNLRDKLKILDNRIEGDIDKMRADSTAYASNIDASYNIVVDDKGNVKFGESDFKDLDENVWRAATKHLSDLYKRNKMTRPAKTYAVLNALHALLKFLILGEVHTVSYNRYSIFSDYISQFADVDLIEDNKYNYYKTDRVRLLLSKALELFSTNNKVIETKGSGERKRVTVIQYWGIPGMERTRKDPVDDNAGYKDMMYPNAGEIMDAMIARGIISADDKEKMLRNMEIHSTDAISDMKSFYKKFRVSYENEYDGRDISNHVVARIYKSIKSNKSRGSASGIVDYSASNDIINSLYTKAERGGGSNATELKNKILGDIRDFYSKKSEDDRGVNDDAFKLVVLTDKRFKILYVLCTLLFESDNNNSLGYGISGKALYGWEWGMKPREAVEIISKGKQYRTKNGIDVYKYYGIDSNHIASDNNICFAISITSDMSEEKNANALITGINENIVAEIKSRYSIGDDSEGKISVKDSVNKDLNAEKLTEFLDKNDIKYDRNGDEFTINVDDSNINGVISYNDLNRGLADYFNRLSDLLDIRNSFYDTSDKYRFSNIYDLQLKRLGVLTVSGIDISKYNIADMKSKTANSFLSFVNYFNMIPNDGRGPVYTEYVTNKQVKDTPELRKTFDSYLIEPVMVKVTKAIEEITTYISSIISLSTDGKARIKFTDSNGKLLKTSGRDLINSVQLNRLNRKGIRDIRKNKMEYSDYDNSIINVIKHINKYAYIVSDENIGSVVPNIVIKSLFKAKMVNLCGGGYRNILTNMRDAFNRLSSKARSDVDMDKVYQVSEDADSLFERVCFFIQYTGVYINNYDDISNYVNNNSEAYAEYTKRLESKKSNGLYDTIMGVLEDDENIQDYIRENGVDATKLYTQVEEFYLAYTDLYNSFYDLLKK